MSGIQIWEMAVIPMLLNNSETWQDLSGKTLKELEKLQLTFLRCLLAIGSGCPIPFLYSKTGILLMEFRILEKKLMFLHHLAHLPETSLAREVFTVQTDYGLPGIAQDCREFLARFGLQNLSRFSKSQFKRIVKAKIHELNKCKIIEQVRNRNYKKIDIEKLSKDDFEMKTYLKELKVDDARLRFKIVSHMTPSVQMNFPSDCLFTNTLWACEGCKSESDVGLRDTQHHILICEAYADYRTGKDFSNDKDLVDYYREVLKHRTE